MKPRNKIFVCVIFFSLIFLNTHYSTSKEKEFLDVCSYESRRSLPCTLMRGGNDKKGDIKFEVIKEGFISGFTEETMLVIDNNDDYQKAFAVIYANLDQMPIIPDVDFNEYTVILAAFGTKNTGGFSISVDNILKYRRYYKVNIIETSPGSNCITNQMVTSPFQVIKVKKLLREIKFNIKKITADCN